MGGWMWCRRCNLFWHTQRQKFDPTGECVKKYVPELRNLPNQYLISPWEAPASGLNDANVQLGLHYPQPIVDLKRSAKDALQAFAGAVIRGPAAICAHAYVEAGAVITQATTVGPHAKIGDEVYNNIIFG